MARTVILGKGGHAGVLAELFRRAEKQVVFLENDLEIRKDDRLVIGVGDLEKRRELFKKFPKDQFIPVIHPIATVAECGVTWPEEKRAKTRPVIAALVGHGLQVMINAVIQTNTLIGHNVLVNTGAQIDHDCIIGDHCVISPGAILCGGVKLGEACFIGAGAIIVEGVELEDETFVPAGSLVVEQGDIRRPQRMVQDGGATASIAAKGMGPFG